MAPRRITASTRQDLSRESIRPAHPARPGPRQSRSWTCGELPLFSL